MNRSQRGEVRLMTPIKMKYLFIFATIIFMTVATLGDAFYRHRQYYPAVGYLSKSKLSLAVGYFIAVNIFWFLGYCSTYILFGSLRPNEKEELWEKLKYIATETLLAFAIFKEDFNLQNLLFFAVLIYTKIFHWLAEERVDYLERSPVIPKLFHARVICHLALLSIIDATFILTSLNKVKEGRSPQIALGFEYTVLFPSVFSILLKYLLHSIEIYRNTPLQDKSIILTHGQILLDFIKIILYLIYLMVMFRLYFIPAFVFRQLFHTVRSFTKAVKDVISFRKAVKYMNRFCPSATKEELEARDSICIVCRENINSEAKKLPCNHIFHGSCLRSWFQRQQNCPTCRFKFLATSDRRRVIIQPITMPPRHHPIRIQHETSNSALTITEPRPNPLMIPQRLPSFYRTASEHNNPGVGTSSTTDNYFFRHTDNLQNVSHQDLLTVERDARVVLENRIKCLQDMTKMIDSTIFLMQEYCQGKTTPLNANGSMSDVNKALPSSPLTQEGNQPGTSEETIHTENVSVGK